MTSGSTTSFRACTSALGKICAHDRIATGQTRSDLSQGDIRDVLWTMTSLEVHDCFVLKREWSPDEYAEWLSDALARVLLDS